LEEDNITGIPYVPLRRFTFSEDALPNLLAFMKRHGLCFEQDFSASYDAAIFHLIKDAIDRHMLTQHLRFAIVDGLQQDRNWILARATPSGHGGRWTLRELPHRYPHEFTVRRLATRSKKDLAHPSSLHRTILFIGVLFSQLR
jgi:hypothetical protein